jgi:hypothetical protein
VIELSSSVAALIIAKLQRETKTSAHVAARQAQRRQRARSVAVPPPASADRRHACAARSVEALRNDLCRETI